MELHGSDERRQAAPASVAQDAVAPALLLALGAMELATFGEPGWQAAVALEAAGAGVLVLRRRHVVWPALSIAPPLVVPVVGPAMNEVSAPILFIVLALYTLGRWYARTVGAAAASTVVVTVILAMAWHEDQLDPTDVVFALVLCAPPYVFGRIVRRLATQQHQLEAQQAELARQAAVEERARIARDLHDVIAHSLSAMVVQTAAARDALRTDPDTAGELLESVAQVGRDALVETGRLLHVVRDVDHELGLSPARGVADVADLVADLRAQGLQVEADLALPSEPLPAGVDVSAYRIVQEALTNALKHGDGEIGIRVAVEDDRLLISCRNRVRPAAPRVAGSGLGLAGIQERAALLGGTVQHRASDGRFHLEALLPCGALP